MAVLELEFDDGTVAHVEISDEQAERIAALLEIFGKKMNIVT